MRGDFTINGNQCGEGCVSSGTLRSEDLIRAFCEEIRKLALRTPRVVYDAESWLRGREKYNDDLDGEEHPLDETEYEERGSELTNELMDQLDGMAPKGWCFGSQEGDGACFGWWRVEDG